MPSRVSTIPDAVHGAGSHGRSVEKRPVAEASAVVKIRARTNRSINDVFRFPGSHVSVGAHWNCAGYGIVDDARSRIGSSPIAKAGRVIFTAWMEGRTAVGVHDGRMPAPMIWLFVIAVVIAARVCSGGRNQDRSKQNHAKQDARQLFELPHLRSPLSFPEASGHGIFRDAPELVAPMDGRDDSRCRSLL